MLRLLIPAILLIVGLASGYLAASFLTPPDEIACTAEDEDCESPPTESEDEETENSDSAFVRMNNQFIVPVIREDRVSSMVVLSLSLEVPPDATESVFQREPLLRDAFLQILFDHA